MKKITFILWFVFLQISLFAQIPTDSLVLYMSFDGNANDESGNGNNGITHGVTLTEDRFGNVNSAYSFNGTSDYMELPNVIPVFAGTLSYWFKTNGSNDGQIIVYHTNTTDNGFGTIHSNAIETHTAISKPDTATYSNWYSFDNGGGAGASDTLNNVEIDQWYNVVVTYDMQDSARMYVDGNLVNTLDLSTETGTNLPTTTYIGRPTMNVRYFNGTFDDFRVYSRVLSPSEITSIFNEYLCYETISIYDTTSVTVYDTTFVTVYDSIAVTDTLIIDAVLTGVNPPNNINTIKIYPNPAKTHIYINNGDYNLMNGYTVKIANMLGQTVYTSLIDQQEFRINISDWSGNGTYFVYVIDGNSEIMEVKKIIIQ